MKSCNEICVNLVIKDNHWEFVSRSNDKVVAHRYGPDGICIGTAIQKNKNTEIEVTLIHRGYLRKAYRAVCESLANLSHRSLTQYWGRLLTFATKWGKF